MTLEQLRIFVAVAEQLHVTRAANSLNLTQSAASAAVAALEAQYQTTLFYRIGRSIALTEAGQVLLAQARAVLKDAAAARRTLEDYSALERGQLNIHASQTIANYWLPPRLDRFKREHPGIALHLTIGNTSQVADAMLNGQSDLGFVEGEVENAALMRIRIPGDRLVLVVGVGHPWFGRKTVDRASLMEARWVLREAGSGTRQVFEAAVRAMGIDPQALKVALELPSNEAVRAAVETGFGATVVSELVVRSSLSHGALHAVGPSWPSRDFEILRHPDRYRSKAEAAFVAMIGVEQGAGDIAPGARRRRVRGAETEKRRRLART